MILSSMEEIWNEINLRVACTCTGDAVQSLGKLSTLGPLEQQGGRGLTSTLDGLFSSKGF